MAFISGNNLGGKEVRYYDNPNYDPKNEGKSKGDDLLKKSAAQQDYIENISQAYDLGAIDDYDELVDAQDSAAYTKEMSDKQTQETVSYFRARERDRLNPDGPANKINNPKFSQPSGSIVDKTEKFGISYDPTDPDTFFDQVFRYPDNAINPNEARTFDTGMINTRPVWNQETMEFSKGTPLDKTVAGINRDLQSVKQRTRDAAMEFRGRVYDFIEDVVQNINDDFAYQSTDFIDPFNNVEGPPTYSYIENKYFPDTASKEQARNTILNMIDSTDNKAPLNSLRGVAEEIAAVKDPVLRDMGVGAGRTNTYGVSNEKTLKNLESGIKEFQAWKSKKGVPRIIRLINKLS
jgi:hypothetical protein